MEKDELEKFIFTDIAKIITVNPELYCGPKNWKYRFTLDDFTYEYDMVGKNVTLKDFITYIFRRIDLYLI